MKITKGEGQAKVMTKQEIQRLLYDGMEEIRDRALFAICLFTGCRISEALGLLRTDVGDTVIAFRKSNTKGKKYSRSVPISPQLQVILDEYRHWYEKECPYDEYLFGSPKSPGKPLSRFQAHRILERATNQCGLEGVSTHSFRRTCLTQMSDSGVPLRHIQSISGHKSLNELARYLEVSPENQQLAISVVGF